MRLFLLPRWRGCWKAIYVFRDRFFEISDPELKFLRLVLKPGDVFVDAGAYHGWYALVASQLVGEAGLVLAFEPNPEAYTTLEQNVAINDGRNIRTFNLATDANGTACLYHGPDDQSPSALAYGPGGVGHSVVTAKRLDDLLTETGIEKVTLMKLDVQGAEIKVLRGATKILRQSRPTLIVEVDPHAAQLLRVSAREAWDMLIGLGYTLFRFRGDGLTPMRQFPTLQDGLFMNVVASQDRADPVASS
jgi:FkbM family methyltransferase